MELTVSRSKVSFEPWEAKALCDAKEVLQKLQDKMVYSDYDLIHFLKFPNMEKLGYLDKSDLSYIIKNLEFFEQEVFVEKTED